MGSPYERFDFETGEFTGWPELHSFGSDEMTAPLAALEPGEVALCDAGVFDIERTTIAALRNFARRYPDSYARVFNAPRLIREVVSAETGVKLLIDTTLHPFSPDEPDLPEDLYDQFIDSGVSGFIVKPVGAPEHIFQAETGMVILKRVSITDDYSESD